MADLYSLEDAGAQAACVTASTVTFNCNYKDPNYWDKEHSLAGGIEPHSQLSVNDAVAPTFIEPAAVNVTGSHFFTSHALPNMSKNALSSASVPYVEDTFCVYYDNASAAVLNQQYSASVPCLYAHNVVRYGCDSNFVYPYGGEPSQELHCENSFVAACDMPYDYSLSPFIQYPDWFTNCTAYYPQQYAAGFNMPSYPYEMHHTYMQPGGFYNVACLPLNPGSSMAIQLAEHGDIGNVCHCGLSQCTAQVGYIGKEQYLGDDVDAKFEVPLPASEISASVNEDSFISTRAIRPAESIVEPPLLCESEVCVVKEVPNEQPIRINGNVALNLCVEDWVGGNSAWNTKEKKDDNEQQASLVQSLATDHGEEAHDLGVTVDKEETIAALTNGALTRRGAHALHTLRVASVSKERHQVDYRSTRVARNAAGEPNIPSEQTKSASGVSRGIAGYRYDKRNEGTSATSNSQTKIKGMESDGLICSTPVKGRRKERVSSKRSPKPQEPDVSQVERVSIAGSTNVADIDTMTASTAALMHCSEPSKSVFRMQYGGTFALHTGTPHGSAKNEESYSSNSSHSAIQLAHTKKFSRMESTVISNKNWRASSRNSGSYYSGYNSTTNLLAKNRDLKLRNPEEELKLDEKMNEIRLKNIEIEKRFLLIQAERLAAEG